MTLLDADPNAWCPERPAATLVATSLGARAHRRDVRGVQLTHDYDIVRTDEAKTALEVTQHAVPQHLAFRSEIRKRSWTSRHISSDWIVDVEVETELNGLFERLVSCLGMAESQGVRTLAVPLRARDRKRHAHAALVGDLHVLGVRMIAKGGHASGAGGIRLSGVLSPTSYDANSVAEVVRDHTIRRSDNRRKLARATDVATRHLFIWVHRDHIEAATALSDGVLPTECPDLPAEIDAVWIALACEGRLTWHYCRDGWHDLGPLLNQANGHLDMPSARLDRR